MKKYIKKFVPSILKPTLEKLYYFPFDLIDQLKGRDSMIPPRSMIFTGGGDFISIGEEFKKYFVELANLQHNSRVLDVGCGLGRMAIPLTKYLYPDGEYFGIDIVKKGIEWCNNRISPKFDNFHFQHSDVYNKYYNPKGKVKAQDYIFPFEDGFFDFIFLTSVFTHMLPSDLENYLKEISRVLKTDGKCLATFFLLNKESESLIMSGKSSQDFKYTLENCLVVDKNYPEASIAYNEEFVVKLFNEFGLEIIQPIHFGNWCNRDVFLNYQDIIIASKNCPS